jgi:hypothetical protein
VGGHSWDDVRLRVPRPPAAARPGTITVQGNLAFQSGALYMVQDHETLDRIDTHTRQPGCGRKAGTEGIRGMSQRVLGLAVPQTVLVAADAVIE